jgi:glycosyltransferase involved in cell wall biosynthesis
MRDLSDKFELISRRSFNSGPPEISVVIPFFNRQNDLKLNLGQLVSMLSVPCDLILINDASEDETLFELVSWVEFLSDNPGSIVEISVYSAKSQQFETRCDHFAIMRSRCQYVLEIQADMFITEQGFDVRLIRAMKSNKDLIALSGRGCHSFLDVFDSFQSSMGAATFDHQGISNFVVNRFRVFTALFLDMVRVRRKRITTPPHPLPVTTLQLDEVFPDLELFQKNACAGKLGQLINSSLDTPGSYLNRIWVGDTVMRGPLLIDKLKYSNLGGFNLKSFFLGYDEHDLFLRANIAGLICGYVPINFRSPLETGSTRAPRSWNTEMLLTFKVIKIRLNRRTCALYTDHDRANINEPTIRYF